MEITVGSLKVGTRIVIGAYSVINQLTSKSSPATPIVWIKASRSCDMITEKIIDILPFDAYETEGYHRVQNKNYEESNLFCFLNSDDPDCWYEAQSANDAPPSRGNIGARYAYAERRGFLADFEDYEIHSFRGRVDLPLISSITGGEHAFEYFRRHGKRAHLSEDAYRYRHIAYGYEPERAFFDYHVRPDHGMEGCYRFTSASEFREAYVEALVGVRPVVQMLPSTPLIVGEDGLFHVRPYEVVKKEEVSDEDIMGFLFGMRRP